MQNISPDIIFYIKIDIKTAQTRIFNRNENLTSFEQEKTVFWEKVINGYETIFKNSTQVVQLDGTLDPQKLTILAINKIKKHIFVL